MVRPHKCRRVGAAPDFTYFKPRGVPLQRLKEIDLSVDGYEALRLADHQGLRHEDAAARMGVSRQTFGRMLSKARFAVAQALVSGYALCIQGGEYKVNKETTMEKIAVTSEGPELDDILDPRFGRAAGFIIIDPKTLEFEYLENGSCQTMSQGAGIQAAENVANSGVKAVLTGYVGPKAFKALSAAGIEVGQNLEDMTVRQAVDAYNNGMVTWGQKPNRQGHGR